MKKEPVQFCVHTPTNEQFVLLDRVMPFILALTDNVRYATFEDDPRRWLPVPFAIEWTEKEIASGAGTPERQEGLRSNLEILKESQRQHLAGELTFEPDTEEQPEAEPEPAAADRQATFAISALDNKQYVRVDRIMPPLVALRRGLKPIFFQDDDDSAPYVPVPEAINCLEKFLIELQTIPPPGLEERAKQVAEIIADNLKCLKQAHEDHQSGKINWISDEDERTARIFLPQLSAKSPPADPAE